MAVFTVEDCSVSRSPGRVLRRLDKLMSAIVTERFARYDISYQQWIALKVVRDGHVATAGELARELGITTGAITRLVDVLEARGLFARARGDDDRRVVRLELTQAGREAVAALQDDVVDSWNEVLVDFTQAEAEAMVSMLVRLLAAAERVAGGLVAEAAE